MTKTMTNEEYVLESGTICPHCRSPEVTSGTMQVDGEQAWADIRCGKCGREWRDLYRLTGFEDIDRESGPRGK